MMWNRVTASIAVLTVGLGSDAVLRAQGLTAPQPAESLLQGSYYQAVVPDTLDLAERARLAVNAITGAADPHNNYEVFQCGHCDQQPANFNHNHGGPCLAKAIDVLPRMRRMSGSRQNEDFDRKIVNSMLRDVDENGLWWIKGEGRPWRDNFGEKMYWPFPQGRLIAGLLAWHDYDRNPQWLPITEKLVRGLHGVAGQNEQRAWFRNSSAPDLELAGFAESYEKTKRESPRFQVFLEAAALKGGGSWSVDRITLEYPSTDKVVLDDEFTTRDIDASNWVAIVHDDDASILQEDGALRFENPDASVYQWNTQIVHSRSSFPAVEKGDGLRMTLHIKGSRNAHYIVGLQPEFKKYPGRESPMPPFGFHQSASEKRLLYPLKRDFSVPVDIGGQNSNYAIRITLGAESSARWEYDLRDGKGWQTAREVEGAVSEIPGEPGAVDMQVNGNPLRALSQWYAKTGDQESRQLAAKLARFMAKPGQWGTGEGPSMADPYEHARWQGHFHWFATGVVGLTDYATTTNDFALLRYLKSYYEYSRQFGIVRIGFFPAVVSTLAQRQNASKRIYGGPGQNDEGCALADMIDIALMLSEAGAGDYWDDIDSMVRNHLVEHQMLDRERLAHIIAHSPKLEINPQIHNTENVIERNIGAFASCAEPTKMYAWWTMCCNANMMLAMHKAWDSIVRFDDGLAQVNLLLNRASPWVDIDSYLPYEGKVVLKNKEAERLSVRMPLWVDRSAVLCQVNGQEIPLRWLGRQLQIADLQPRDAVTITFPMVETTERHTEPTYATTYTCRFKGNTLMDIAPRPEEFSLKRISSDDGSFTQLNKEMGYPLYRREHLQANKAPTKEVTRYVHQY
ncbi:MAG: glycoside hydrolase family 127 protein [Pirellulaceae bacterium]|nr:glycoside hydrolase family 127 protein [Pirellulaceae bacterium]